MGSPSQINKWSPLEKYVRKFKERFGENPLFVFRNELNKLVEEKLIIVEDNNIKLTNKGLDLANLVWEEFVK